MLHYNLITFHSEKDGSNAYQTLSRRASNLEYVCTFMYTNTHTHTHTIVNVGEDCPVFDGMYEFCQLSAGGSLGKLTK